MSEFPRILVTLLFAANPFLLAAALGGRPRTTVLAQAAATAGLILIVAAGVAGPLLDALSIEPETFRIAAGVIMLVTGAAAAFPFGSPRAIPIGETGRFVPGVFPLGWPGLASAGAVAAAMSYSADSGAGVTVIAAVLAVAVSLGALSVIARSPRIWPLSAGRFCGGVLVVLAVDLIVAGIQDV